MPYLRLETNVPSESIPKDLPQKLCEILAESLGKPIGFCTATVVGGANMAWGGSTEPTAQATLSSVGALGVAQNKKYSKILFECIYNAIGVSPDRMYIMFNDVASSNVGYNGKTLHDLLG